MKHGVPLTDEDREPWLDAIHAALLACVAKKQDALLACSALKQSYRETLAAGVDLRICYLHSAIAVLFDGFDLCDAVRQHFNHRNRQRFTTVGEDARHTAFAADQTD